MHSDAKRYVAAVYPFTRDFAPFCGADLTYEGDTIGVRELVAPKGMGIGDMDAGLGDARP